MYIYRERSSNDDYIIANLNNISDTLECPCRFLSFGTMHIYRRELTSAQDTQRWDPKSNIKYLDEEFWASDPATLFCYNDLGSIKMWDSGKSLIIDRFGRLKVGNFSQLDFQLKHELGNDRMSILSFKGQDVFELCGDGLIGFDSHCNRNTKIMIIFEELWNNKERKGRARPPSIPDLGFFDSILLLLSSQFHET